MKKVLYLSLLFITVSLVACKSGGVSQESLEGKWQVTAVDFHMKNMPEGAEQMIPMMKKAFLETKYEFNTDGTYSIQSVFPKQGKWTLDETKNAIVLDNDKEEVENTVLKVLSSSADKLDLKNDKGEEEGYIDFTIERIKE